MAKYKVGDLVRIVDSPNYNCDFGWDDDEETGMSQYCGMEAHITDVSKGYYSSADEYIIDIDDGRFAWDEDCFVAPDPEIVDSGEDISVLLFN